MRVLAIETSCDETSLAVVTMSNGKFEIEKNITSSQAKIHAQYGGVVPEVAAREHAAWIFPLINKIGIPHDGKGIDAVAVTAGPGLVAALRIGVELAKALAWSWHKPLVPVNHLEGHIYSVWFKTESAPELPAVCLLVSGGHTELIFMKNHGKYELLGRTRDDAAGEAFDKVAKLMGMDYPGGPKIAKAAREGNATAITFPRPMINSGDFDFSFAGLKTAVRVRLSNFPLPKGELRRIAVANISASFLQAVIDVLVVKTLKAVELTCPRSVIISGGVSADRHLRVCLKRALHEFDSTISFHTPDLSLTGDNAAMIGAAGLIKASRNEFTDPLKLKADPNLHLA